MIIASVYNNQPEIGSVLSDCFSSNTISRDSLHITSKIWNNEHENVAKSVENTLKQLNIGSLDFMFNSLAVPKMIILKEPTEIHVI